MTEFEIVYGIWHPRCDVIFAKHFQTDEELWFLKNLSSHQNYKSKETAEEQCSLLNYGTWSRFFVKETLKEIK